MAWSGPGQYLTAHVREVFDYWVAIVEDIFASSSTCKNQLRLWVEPIGLRYKSGDLYFPYCSKSTKTNLWNGIERYWQEQIIAYRHQFYLNDERVKYVDQSESIDYYYIGDLSAMHHGYRYKYFDLMDAVYQDTTAALRADKSYLESNISQYDEDFVVAGLLSLFQYFVAWSAVSTNAGNFYYSLPSYSEGYGDRIVYTTDTVGPYTVTVAYCENGVVQSLSVSHPELPPIRYSVCHQSVDCELLLQDEEQTELSADILVGYRHTEDLDADIIVYGGTASPLDADVALQGDVQTPLRSSICLEDKTEYPLPADGLLAADHQFPLGAHIAVAYGRYPLDADICVQSPTLLSLAASMYVEPDFESEELTRLERAHIQKFRITADPRKYEVFNSETDTEVVP